MSSLAGRIAVSLWKAKGRLLAVCGLSFALSRQANHRRLDARKSLKYAAICERVLCNG